jgi:ATP-dependent protease ClpP protease subunit
MPGHYSDNKFYIGDFDDELENQIIIPLTKEIGNQADKRDGTIDLHINSAGGYSHLVFHLIELVALAIYNGVTVRTSVPNMAFSAGSMLAITGSPGQRYIGRHAEHLVHYGAIMSMETTPNQIERYRRFKERNFKATVAHYRKYSNIPDLDQQMLDDAYFIPAKDCIKYKLADKFMERLEL